MWQDPVLWRGVAGRPLGDLRTLVPSKVGGTSTLRELSTPDPRSSPGSVVHMGSGTHRGKEGSSLVLGCDAPREGSVGTQPEVPGRALGLFCGEAEVT